MLIPETWNLNVESLRGTMSYNSTFYHLLEEAAKLHARKSHDYASDENPYGNYHFAGQMARMFENPDDSGFVGRFGEKLYRLANLENNGKVPLNEAIDDTEIDMLVILALWISDRRERRKRQSTVDCHTLELPFPNPQQVQAGATIREILGQSDKCLE